MEKIIRAICKYEAETKIERNKIIVTISENKMKKIVASYYAMFGIAPSDYRSVTIAGATLIQSEMLKDNEIVIGVKKII